MRVSILTPDLSSNCLGRAYLLAHLLERNHSVEIIGPELGNGIWGPLRDEYDYKRIGTSSMVYEFPWKVPRLTEQITGDVVYASKPKTTSFGVGLLYSISRDIPLVLDIDDWEVGFVYGESHPLVAHLKNIENMVDMRSVHYTWFLERLRRLSDGITVSNGFLKEKFGGEVIYHARDTDRFDPSRFDKYRCRSELGLPDDKTIVMFSGTPRPHKGVDDLIKGVKQLDREDIVLVVVGAHDSPYVDELKRLSGEQVIFRAQQPFDHLPKWIAAADIITIPQKKSQSTKGQLPAKVFDAMAMAKPIIATGVSDLPQILDGCGIVIEPGSPPAIATAINQFVDQSEERKELGQKARERCINKYSYDAIAPRLNRAIELALS